MAKEITMQRYTVLVLALLLSGCGVELAGGAAVSGVGKAQETRQAQQNLQHFQQKLDAANQASQQQRDAAERAAGQ